MTPIERAEEGAGITGGLVDLYDVFVDWPGRLAREMPGIEAHLAALGPGPKRVLDVGCGTGRHVAALLGGGHDAHGADASPEMLARAGELVGRERLHLWRLGDPPSAALRAAGPFDAVIAMGNVWPHVIEDRDVRASGAGLRELLRPGGLVLLGLKAFAVRAREGSPYLPLLRRAHAGGTLLFVRVVDFDAEPTPLGARRFHFHVLVVGGEADGPLLHRVSDVRAWGHADLARSWEAMGFTDVRVSRSLTEPELPPEGEDVYLDARSPGPPGPPGRGPSGGGQ